VDDVDDVDNKRGNGYQESRVENRIYVEDHLCNTHVLDLMMRKLVNVQGQRGRGVGESWLIG
jgi:hypothetical protein